MSNNYEKIRCEDCGKHISKTNIATHKKRCKHQLVPEKKTYHELEKLLETQKNDLEKSMVEKDLQLRKSCDQNSRLMEENNRLKRQLEALITQGPGNTTNNMTNNNTNCNNVTNNVTNVTNNYYVIDTQGLRDGLDMTKLRNFGEENVSYVDKTQPLPKILKDIYYNEDHMENRVISHQKANLQWMLFKCQDYLVRLNLEMNRESVPLMEDLVCDNVQKLLGKKFDLRERRDAILELLAKFDDEARALTDHIPDDDEADKELPVWNRAQSERYKELFYQREPAFGFTYPERMYIPPK